jgi:hypothetical protein
MKEAAERAQEQLLDAQSLAENLKQQVSANSLICFCINLHKPA